MTDSEVCQWSNEEEVAGKTVIALKGELARLNLSTKGKKAELVSRLMETIEQQSKINIGPDCDFETTEYPSKVISPFSTTPGFEENKVPSPVPTPDNSVLLLESPLKNSMDDDSEMVAEEVVSSGFIDETEHNNITISENKGATLGQKDESTSSSSAKRHRVSSSEVIIEHVAEDIIPSKRPRSVSPYARTKIKEDGKLNDESNAVQIDQTNENNGPVSIRIDNFVRPFTVGQARDLLENATGVEVVGFWMDKIKTHAIATLPSKLAAKRAFDALNGLQWPERSSKLLAVTYSDISACDAALNAQNVTETVDKPKEYQIGKTEIDTVSKRVEKTKEVEQEKRPERKKVEEEPPISLDDLYRRTAILPVLYWQPNTEDQIAHKKSIGYVSATITQDANADGTGNFDHSSVNDVKKSYHESPRRDIRKNSRDNLQNSTAPYRDSRNNRGRRGESRMQNRRF